MKKFHLLKLQVHLLSLVIACLLPLFTQAQLVKERFDKLLISENFDSINTKWTTMANADNLFIVQDGEYILQRKATSAPYAILANFEESYNNFRVITSIKIDKTLSESAYAGFLFMMQSEGQGGYLIELNKAKEYRLRQIVNGSYKYITGNSKTAGWVKNNYLNEAGVYNMIEIRKMTSNYDLYINNNFVQSFSEPAYKSGKLGIIIGPSTRCKVDFMYVFSITSANDLNAVGNNLSESPNSGEYSSPDIIELAESIILLKTQNNKISEENEDLRKTISAMKSDDQEKEVTAKNYEKQIKSYQDQITKNELTIDSLSKKNTELMKFKELAGGNENGDLIIVLSKNLKSEKEKNAALEKELKELKENSGVIKSDPEKGSTKSGKTNSGSSGQKDSIKKESSTFKLPVEN